MTIGVLFTEFRLHLVTSDIQFHFNQPETSFDACSTLSNSSTHNQQIHQPIKRELFRLCRRRRVRLRVKLYMLATKLRNNTVLVTTVPVYASASFLAGPLATSIIAKNTLVIIVTAGS